MMLTGRIGKDDGFPPWFAECEVIGAFTQGESRKDALAMLADCVQGLVVTNGGPKDFKVTATEIGESADGSIGVLIESTQPHVLAAHVLRYQRELNKLTQTDVAEKIDGTQGGYAPYERGERDPSLTKYVELLGAVAPDLALMIGPRKAKASR